MITRRGFIGLVAGAVGAASALPSLGWFEAEPPPAALDQPAIRLRHFVATAGKELSHLSLWIGEAQLLSLAVAPRSSLSWFGTIVIGPKEKLRVEIKGDLMWSAVASDDRIFTCNGSEVVEL